MSDVSVSLQFEAFDRYQAAMRQVSEGRARRAFSMAMNERSKVGFNDVKRSLIAQTSLPRPIVQKGMRLRRSTPATLTVEMVGVGKGISLKHFGGRQFKAGVRAKVWGQFRMFNGLFMGPRPGNVAAKLGGHAFYRVGAKSWVKNRMTGGKWKHTAIRKGYGPGIAKELVKDQARMTFTSHVNRLGPAFDRILKAIGEGKIPSGRE